MANHDTGPVGQMVPLSFNAKLAGAAHGHTCAGRRIGVGFVNHLRETLTLSSVDAQPFVPAALRGLFDQEPRERRQDMPPLAPMFKAR